MIDFLQWIGAIGGVGAVFAILMFFVLMKVFKIMREDRKYMEDRLTAIIDAYNKSTQDNTQIQEQVLTWLKARNGNSHKR